MSQVSRFQTLVGRSIRFWFPNTKILENYRPDWLKGMELDFYFPDFRVGVEVQGTQHYLFVPEMQGTVENFTAQRKRDQLKRRLAAQEKVKVITISSFDGIYKKFRNAFPNRSFPLLPLGLKADWESYKKLIHENKKTKWTSFKVKKSGEVIKTR